MEQFPNSGIGKEIKETDDNKEFSKKTTKKSFKKADSIFSNENESDYGFNSLLFLASEFTADSDSEAIIPIKKVPDINEIATLKRKSVQIEANYSNFPFNVNKPLESNCSKELDLEKDKEESKLKTNNLLCIDPVKFRRFSTPVDNLINQAKILTEITETNHDKNNSLKSKDTETDTLQIDDYFKLNKDKNISYPTTETLETNFNLNNQASPYNPNKVYQKNDTMKFTIKKQNTFNNTTSLNNNANAPVINVYPINDNNNFKAEDNDKLLNTGFSSISRCKTTQVGGTNTGVSSKPILLINNQPVQTLRMKNQQILENINNKDQRQYSPGIWNQNIFPNSNKSSSNTLNNLNAQVPTNNSNQVNNLLGGPSQNLGMTLFAPYSPPTKLKEQLVINSNSPFSQNYKNSNENYLSSNVNSPINKAKIPLPHFQQPITMNTMVYHNLLVSQYKKPQNNKKDLDNSNSTSTINCSSAEDKNADSIGNSKQTKKNKNKKKENTREGDWICLECQNLNFSFRNTCNKCSYERQVKDNEEKS